MALGGGPTAYDVVTNGRLDVAKTHASDMMRVEAVGRVPSQKVYLWAGSTPGVSNARAGSKLSIIPYDPATDRPVAGPPSLLPTPEELTSGTDTRQYLEVGLIIGDEPDRYRLTGLRNKENEHERRTRGVLNRDPSAMRVFVPITPVVLSQLKYYVGVNPTGGRCSPRVIKSDVVFFYPEFLVDMPDHFRKRKRNAFISKAVRCHAAQNKTTPEHLDNPSSTLESIEDEAVDNDTVDDDAVDDDAMDEDAASDDVVDDGAMDDEVMDDEATEDGTTEDEITDEDTAEGDVIDVEVIGEDVMDEGAMGGGAPTTTACPYATYPGIKAVLASDEELKHGDAHQLYRELADVDPMQESSIPVAKAVSRIMRTGARDGRFIKAAMASVLRMCSQRFNILNSNDEAEMEAKVDEALDILGSLQ